MSATIILIANQTATIDGSGLTAARSFTLPDATGTLLLDVLADANIWVGNSLGIATSVSVSGDITLANTGVATIANNAVTNAKAAQMAANAIKGNNTSTTTSPADLTVAEVLTMLGFPASSSVLSPGGRLTLQSGAPVMTGDMTGANSVFYDSYISQLVPLYNGSAWSYLPIASDEISLALSTTNHLAGNIYDVFAINVGGVLTLVTGPAWTSTIARSIVIARHGGILTNSSILNHAYHGATDYGPISANQATLLGSIYCTSNGQTSAQFTPASVASGPAGIVAISNAYNTCNATYFGSDSTVSWPYSSTVWRHANNSSNNIFVLLDSLGTINVDADYLCTISDGANGSQGRLAIGIDWSGGTPTNGLAVSMYSGATTANAPSLMAKNKATGLLGLHTYAALEWASSVGTTFYSGAVSGTTPSIGGLAIRFAY